MRHTAMVLAAICSAAATLGSAPTDAPLDSTPSSGTWLDSGLEQVSVERMLTDIRELSSPTFNGRQTGTDDDRKSSTFVADRFAALWRHRPAAAVSESRSTPLPHRQWQQTAPVVVRTIQNDPVLRIGPASEQPPLRIGSDFFPILDSPSADILAPIVFVGYGLSNPAQGIDDYAGVDVRNKIVLFLRGKPDTYTGDATHADKERIAHEKGAVAYLTATGPILTPYELRRGVTGAPTAFYSGADPAHRLPGAWIDTAIAEAIVRSGTQGNAELRDLQKEISANGISRSIATDVTGQLAWTTVSSPGTLYNVIALIPGYSLHADETVVIGAHRDHFGRQGGRLFAGADDNASGTAVMLEVARVLASAPSAPKRSILFISFSGEEQGLLGSRLYVSQPITPLAKTVGMINVDHAGVGNGRLTIGVTGMDKRIAIEAGRAAGVQDRLDLHGFFPGGDHVPFKEAGVPTVTVVSGGVHPHFHQPSDTADTIDPEILKTVARYVLALAWQLANEP